LQEKNKTNKSEQVKPKVLGFTGIRACMKWKQGPCFAPTPTDCGLGLYENKGTCKAKIELTLCSTLCRPLFQ